MGTKAGEEYDGSESTYDFRGDWIRQSVDRSLGRLGRDRLEILLLHSDGRDVSILDETDAVAVLKKLKQDGKLAAIGISTKTIEGAKRAYDLDLDVVMATYNPWFRDEEEVLDVAADLGKSVLIKKALGSGWLGGKDSKKSGSADPVAEAFDFIFGHPGATAAVVGTLNPDNLRKNAAAMPR